MGAKKKGKGVPRPPISQPSRLTNYSNEHVKYEIEMLLQAAILSGAPLQWFFANARTEAFAQHLRNLIEFLFPDRFGRRPDDVSAHHFLASRTAYSDWLKVRPRLSRALAKAKQRADKELAHLTAARMAGTPPPKTWLVCALLIALDDVLVVFAAQADHARLGAGARAAIAALSGWVTVNCRVGIVVTGTLTTTSTQRIP